MWNRSSATSIGQRHEGMGVTGFVSGKEVFAGSKLPASKLGASIPEEMENSARASEQQGLTVMFFGWDGEVEGFASFR